MEFLTEEELETLTGYKRRKEQKEWLSRRGYPWEENGQGRVLVLREYVRRRFGCGEGEEPKSSEPKPKLKLP